MTVIQIIYLEERMVRISALLDSSHLQTTVPEQEVIQLKIVAFL